MKHQGLPQKRPKEYFDLHMPRNTGMGVYIGLLSFTLGFGMIWHMFWLSALSALGIIACSAIRLFDQHTEYYVPASEVAAVEEKRS